MPDPRDASFRALIVRYIDRMNDVSPECGDPAERIVEEFAREAISLLRDEPIKVETPIEGLRERMKRTINWMRDCEQQWRRPALRQIEGPDDLKIYGGTIADDIGQWVDALAEANDALDTSGTVAWNEETVAAIDYSRRWLAYGDLHKPIATPFPRNKMRLLLEAIRGADRSDSKQEWCEMATAPNHDGATIIGYDPLLGVSEMMLTGSKTWALATFNGQIMTANPTLWRSVPKAPTLNTGCVTSST